MYGGSSTHIPLKVNTGGVIPVIFAVVAAGVPGDAGGMFAAGTIVRRVADQLGWGMPLYNLLYVSLHHLLRVLLHGHHLQPR